MSIYETESGYEVHETLGGLEVYDNDEYVCEIGGKTLESYRDEDDNIDDDALEADIEENMEAEEFLNYQQEYC